MKRRAHNTSFLLKIDVYVFISRRTSPLFLDEYSVQLKDNQHVLMIVDGAGWHHANSLVIPTNITLHFLPAYSPELNPIERLWLWLKNHYLFLEYIKLAMKY